MNENGMVGPSHHPGSPAHVSPPEIPDYELVKRIGQGSYGEVWLARSVMGTCRAVKIVYRQAFESDRPFEREFDGIKRFEPVSQTHESQLKVFHVGRRNGYFYYVMELADPAEPVSSNQSSVISNQSSVISNQSSAAAQLITASLITDYSPRTLRSELQRRGRLPVEESLDLSIKLTQALAHLHRHGLVHRDIKPSNIIFVNGQPKLADIGLVADTEGTLSFVGTEGYLPPEGPGKPPADIFSLGKVLYEISTGHDRNQFPELPALWDSIPEREAFAELNEVIIKACAAEASKRYATAEQMHQDLLLVRAGKSIRRLRALEQRLAWLAKLSVAAIALTALVLAGYFYQQHQTRTSKRLAAQLQINNGIRLLDEGDFQGSLLWFAEALREEDSYLNADERAQRRLRMGTVLQQCPKLAQVIVPDLGGGKVADYGGSAEFSPDGRQILISGYGRTVLICDAATGKTLQRLEHRANVKVASFSRAGRRVLTLVRDTEANVAGEAQVWDASTGQRVGQPLGLDAKDEWLSAVISDDGKQVLTSSGREVQIWDADSGREILPPLIHESAVAGGSFSSDGRRVLTSSRPWERAGGAAQLWDATTGKKLGPPMRPNSGSIRAQFNRDATRVLTYSRDDVKVWDAQTIEPLLTIPGPHRGDGFFTPDGKRIVLLGLDNGLIQVHDAITAVQIGPAMRQQGGCSYTVVSPDGRRIASFGAKRLHVWEVINGCALITPVRYHNHCRAAFSPEGSRLLTAGAENDPVIRVWDLSGAESQMPSMPHGRQVFRATFSPDGRRIVTASEDETAGVWDAATTQPINPPLHTNHTTDYSLFASYGMGTVARKHVMSFVFHPVIGDRVPEPDRSLQRTNRAVFFAAFAPDSRRLVTTSYDSTARVWEAGTGRELLSPLKHQGAVFHAAFSPDGRRIVTASADWTAQVWAAETGRPVGPPLRHRGAVLHADFSQDGRAVITASYDMTAQVWVVETGAKLGPPLKHWNIDNGPVYSAKFSPDAQRIVTASYDGTAQIWDARTGNKISPPLRHRGFVLHAEFSPEGNYVLTASIDHTAQLWSVATGAKAAPPLAHAHGVNHATFSADGKRIVTASFDGTARVWDPATGQPLTPPLRHRDKVWHAEFSPDGKRVLTASADGTARLWPLAQIDWPVTDLRLLAQTLAGRQIDHTGSLSPLAPEALRENWRKLQFRQPDYFRDSPPKRVVQE